MNIAERYEQTLEQIALAVHRAGRRPGEVQLVVVTKGHPPQAIQEVVAAGARVLGENYLEEALPKMQALRSLPISWHMIGHVQSRKAQAVVEAGFSCLHSLDRLKLAHRLSKATTAPLPVLLECNVSGESSKFGWAAWEETVWPKLVDEFSAVIALPGLQVQGLMTMAPYGVEETIIRQTFERLRRLRDFLAHQLPEASWEQLSMGMSSDFEIAIESGATLVRIGTAIMGPRVT